MRARFNTNRSNRVLCLAALLVAGSCVIALAVTLPIPLIITGDVHGRVIADRSGQPLQQSVVIIPGSKYTAITDAEGRFHIDRVPAVKLRIKVMKSGFDSSEREITVVPNKRVCVTFRLKRPDVAEAETSER